MGTPAWHLSLHVATPWQSSLGCAARIHAAWQSCGECCWARPQSPAVAEAGTRPAPAHCKPCAAAGWQVAGCMSRSPWLVCDDGQQVRTLKYAAGRHLFVGQTVFVQSRKLCSFPLFLRCTCTVREKNKPRGSRGKKEFMGKLRSICDDRWTQGSGGRQMEPGSRA